MTMAARIANDRKTAMSMFPNMVIMPMMAIASARTAVAGPLVIDSTVWTLVSTCPMMPLMTWL